jgi:hypothetical protein
VCAGTSCPQFGIQGAEPSLFSKSLDHPGSRRPGRAVGAIDRLQQISAASHFGELEPNQSSSGKVVTHAGGTRTRKISKFEAINARLINAALAGDLKACLKILSMVSPADIRDHVLSTIERKEPVTLEEATAEYMRMIRGD